MYRFIKYLPITLYNQKQWRGTHVVHCPPIQIGGLFDKHVKTKKKRLPSPVALITI